MASSRKPKGYDDLAREIIERLMRSKAAKEAKETATKRLGKMEAESAAKKALQQSKKKGIKNVQREIRRAEFLEAKATNRGGYNDYMEVKKGVKQPSEAAKKKAKTEGKRIEGQMASRFAKQNAKEAELKQAIKDAPDAASKRKARQKYNKWREDRGR